MTNTDHTQSEQHVFTRQSSTANGQQLLRSVRQDNPTPPRERIASTQPASHETIMRTHGTETNAHRTQKRLHPKRKTIAVTFWMSPVERAQLQQVAQRKGLSVSLTGRAFVVHMLQEQLATQQGALLETIIDKSIGKHMRAYSTRLAVLLVRSLFTSEQTRSLATNILGRQPGITPKELNEILDGSSRAAKRNITHVTPQLTQLIAEVEQWIEEGEKLHG
jgi:hypothetical protein